MFVQNPAAGTWTIRVLGDEIVQDGHVETGAIDADYALIVSGGTSGPPPTPPAAPTGLTANAVSCNQIDLAWTDNSDNETSFKIERGTDGINFSQIDTVGANITTYSDTTAAENTTYYYRVRASNSAGDSDYTNTANATTPACPSPPAAPTGLTANAVSCNQIDLAWTDNSDDETSFKIERGTDGINFSQIDTVGANVTAYSDTTAAENTTYYYRVRASNAFGDSGYSNTANATTPACPVPPAAPTGLTANAVSCNQINLAWTDNSNNETSFKIERGTDGINFSQIDTVGADFTAYSDTTAAENTTYYYRVRASNAFGDSGYSNTANATTPLCGIPPAAPTNLKARGKGKAKITLTWNDNANNEDGFYIYRGTDGVNFNLIDTIGPNLMLYDDLTAQSKITYYYKVCAYNGAGESCSNVASASKK